MFSFSIATVLPIGNTKPIGIRYEMFDCTGKNICTCEVYLKYMKEECNRVKELKGKCLPWYVNIRPENEFWMEDSVKMLKGAEENNEIS